jgi:ADP-dependent phosphofructokinase/glucokinase
MKINELILSEAPIEMDPADPMDPMIYGHDRANPGKLKYRMARAAGQLKDLASRVDGASASEWQLMARQFEELKMNMEQIRHALEELSKVKSKGGIRSRGIEL